MPNVFIGHSGPFQNSWLRAAARQPPSLNDDQVWQADPLFFTVMWSSTPRSHVHQMGSRQPTSPELSLTFGLQRCLHRTLSSSLFTLCDVQI